MSALLEQLHTLRKQAGVIAVPPAERPLVPEDLRKLLGMRMAMQKRGYSQDRVLPGVEIAPGVLYLEEFFACEDSPDIINANSQSSDHKNEHCLYCDTETPGLSAARYTAFMIGAADWLKGNYAFGPLYLHKGG